jgi:hypothetical protein
MKKQAFLFAAAALLALAARPAEAQRHVRCESRDYRERLCRADTAGGVRLARQLGDAACRQGRTWGTTRSGIWVSNGCRADFEVGRGIGGIVDAWRGRTGDLNRGSNGDWQRRSNGDWNRGSFGNASARCRAAVASRIRTRVSSVETWTRRQSGSSVELGWRANRADGTCRVDRNGRVRVDVDSNGYRGRDRRGDYDRDRDYGRDRDHDRDHDRDRDRRHN